jgi:hypothetical protein
MVDALAWMGDVITTRAENDNHFAELWYSFFIIFQKSGLNVA